METCQDLRPHGPANDLGAYRSGSKYGFVEKVIDGMTVTINSVYVKFNSPSFTTSFQVSFNRWQDKIHSSMVYIYMCIICKE